MGLASPSRATHSHTEKRSSSNKDTSAVCPHKSFENMDLFEQFDGTPFAIWPGRAFSKEAKMLNRILSLTATLALTASVAFAGTADRKNLQVFNDISKSVNRYPHFTI